MGIDPVTVGIILAAASTATGVVSMQQQAAQQSKAKQSANNAAAEQARQLRAAAAQERGDRIRRLQIAQGRTLALTAASGGVEGTGQLLLGQLVRDAQTDLASTSANNANRQGANRAQLNSNLASIGSTNTALGAGSALLGGVQAGIGGYQAATEINTAIKPPAPAAPTGHLSSIYSPVPYGP